MNLKKTPYLVLFVILIAGGMTGAYALTITLGADLIEILGILDMNNNKITNVGNPTAPADAATKQYVDQAPSTDTLALLGCTTDQVPKWDGTNWVCSNVSSVSFGSFALDSGNIGLYTSIAIGTDEFPVISYGGEFSENLFFIHCTDVSCLTTDNPVTLDSVHDNEAENTSIAIGTDGFPVISYYVRGDNNDLKLVHCKNISCSGGEGVGFDIPITVDSEGDVGRFTSIAIGTDGFPSISYHDGTGNGLKFAHCTNVSCSEFDSNTLNSDGEFTSLAIGTDGFPVISYGGSSSGLRLIHCLSVSCGVQGEIFINDPPVLLDSNVSTAIYTSIAIGSDGFPVISYRDNNLNLKLVHCKNVSCSGGVGVGFDTPVTLDSVGSTGLYTSLAIGTDGFPVISYYYNSGNNLKLVHCKNVSCSGGVGVGFDNPIRLDSEDLVGEYTSIASSSNGYNVISYSGENSFNLKVSVCPVQGDCIGSKVIFE